MLTSVLRYIGNSFFLFSRPVIIEVPHFAALRGKEREIVILRSDNGETWKEHNLDVSEEVLNEVLYNNFEPDGKDFRFVFYFISSLKRTLPDYRSEPVGRRVFWQNHEDSDERFSSIFRGGD